MKSIILNILFLGVCIQGFAADSLKTDTAANKPVFTIVKQNPITSIKNQSKSAPAGITPRFPSLSRRYCARAARHTTCARCS